MGWPRETNPRVRIYVTQNGGIELLLRSVVDSKAQSRGRMASGRVAGAVGGYDVTFVQLLHPDFECPVCLLAMRDPVQTPCGHAFCKSCFNQVAR